MILYQQVKIGVLRMTSWLIFQNAALRTVPYMCLRLQSRETFINMYHYSQLGLRRKYSITVSILNIKKYVAYCYIISYNIYDNLERILLMSSSPTSSWFILFFITDHVETISQNFITYAPQSLPFFCFWYISWCCVIVQIDPLWPINWVRLSIRRTEYSIFLFSVVNYKEWMMSTST